MLTGMIMVTITIVTMVVDNSDSSVHGNDKRDSGAVVVLAIMAMNVANCRKCQ